ncbi:MAG: HypC/HybG/HupF family hydrogenase formation chaperone [Chloroflexota bacterium]|nr:HypC/HybG/HupF family hydrogenase formation chaperone [Anaerolineae bacterium]
MCLAIPTLITSIDEDQVAKIEIGGIERAISLIFTPEARVGDYALIHSGYAIGILAPEEAEETLRLLREMEEAAEAEEAAAEAEDADAEAEYADAEAEEAAALAHVERGDLPKVGNETA